MNSVSPCALGQGVHEPGDRVLFDADGTNITRVRGNRASPGKCVTVLITRGGAVGGTGEALVRGGGSEH